MATITASASGGTRVWSDTATWVGGVKPGAGDDVLLTATSGNVTIDANALARSVNCTGYTGTLTHNSGAVLKIGDATAGLSNVAFKLVAGMAYTVVSNSSEINYVSTSATQQTLDYAGKIPSITRFIGTGSSYLYSSSMVVGSGVNIQAGTVDTNSLSHSFISISTSGAVAKTLTLGSSAITITGVGITALNLATAITFTANTSVITFNGATTGVTAGVNMDMNGASVVFDATAVTSATVTGTGTLAFKHLTYNNVPNKTSNLIFAGTSGNISLTGTITVSGNSATNRPLVSSDLVGKSMTISAAAFSFSNVDFLDMTAAGAGGTWTGTSMGNCLGNSNITFDTPATQTHTSSTGGNWSDATKWTSRVPLPQDNVVVNSSTTGTLTADMPRLGADVDFTGFVGTGSFASVPNTVYGSLKWASGMTASGTQALTFAARSSKTINSNGISFPMNVTFSAPGGTYTMQDAWVSAGASGLITFSRGTLSTNGQPVTANWAVAGSSSSDVLTITNSTLSCPNTSGTPWNVTGTQTLNVAGSTITYSATSSSARTFAGGGLAYNTFTYTVAGSTGSLTITGSNSFNTLNFSDATNARSLLFTAGTTTAINTFNVLGTVGKLMTVDSATAATHTLNKPVGTVSTDYLSVKNSIVDAGRWYAGANSTNVSGNTNWTFTVPPAASTYVFSDAAYSSARVALGPILLNKTRVVDFTPTLTPMMVDKVLTIQWNVVTPVTATVSSYQWNVFTSIGSSSKDYNWNVLPGVTPVDATHLDFNWNVLASIGSNIKDYNWNARAIVSATVSGYQWNVRAAVSPTVSSYLWNVRAAVNASVSGYTWNTRAAINTVNNNFNWTTLLGVDALVSEYNWNILSIVGTDQSTAPYYPINYLTDPLNDLSGWTVEGWEGNVSDVVFSASGNQIVVDVTAAPGDSNSNTLANNDISWNWGGGAWLSVQIDELIQSGGGTSGQYLVMGFQSTLFDFAGSGDYHDYIIVQYDESSDQISFYNPNRGGTQYQVPASDVTGTLVVGYRTSVDSLSASLYVSVDGGSSWTEAQTTNMSDLDPTVVVGMFFAMKTTDTSIDTQIKVSNINVFEPPGSGGILDPGYTGQTNFDWNVIDLAPVDADPIDFNWNVLSTVDKTGVYQWQTLMAELGVGWAFNWNVLTTVNKSLDNQWNVLAPVSASVTDTAWNVLGAVSATSLGASWNVLAHVESTVSGYNWNTLAPVNSTLSHDWDLAAALFETKTNQWNILNIINRTDSYTWNILHSLSLPGVDYNWNITEVVSTVPKSYNWRVFIIMPPHVNPGEIKFLSGEGFMVILSNEGAMNILAPGAAMDIV